MILLAEDAALGVDLVDRELDAVAKLVPAAPAPESSTTLRNFTVCACVGERNAAEARGESNSTRDLSMPSSQMSSRWRLARTVSGSLAAPLPPFLARDEFMPTARRSLPQELPGSNAP